MADIDAAFFAFYMVLLSRRICCRCHDRHASGCRLRCYHYYVTRFAIFTLALFQHYYSPLFFATCHACQLTPAEMLSTLPLMFDAA